MYQTGAIGIPGALLYYFYTFWETIFTYRFAERKVNLFSSIFQCLHLC